LGHQAVVNGGGDDFAVGEGHLAAGDVRADFGFYCDDDGDPSLRSVIAGGGGLGDSAGHAAGDDVVRVAGRMNQRDVLPSTGHAAAGGTVIGESDAQRAVLKHHCGRSPMSRLQC
jgi:hypothetical protein